jgi:hypothetical protein
VTIDGDGLRFASAGLQAKAASALKIVPGAVIRVIKDRKTAGVSRSCRKSKVPMLH